MLEHCGVSSLTIIDSATPALSGSKAPWNATTSLGANVLPDVLGKVNFLLITFDSCRWDTWQRANTPVLDASVTIAQAQTQGTFTFPAHMAMFQGILPQVDARVPYYNRYATQLVKIARKGAPPGLALIEFPPGTIDIVSGFAGAGYTTLGWGAVGWFRHPALSQPFDEFVFTGIHACRQVEEFVERTRKVDGPFFSLINFGETHFPYRYGERIHPPLTSPASRPLKRGGFDRDGWLAQVACCEYLDARVGEVLSYLRTLSRPTIVVVCGDHGECFGENGLTGHGFFHPKVMAVPLGIFAVNGHWSLFPRSCWDPARCRWREPEEQSPS